MDFLYEVADSSWWISKSAYVAALDFFWTPFNEFWESLRDTFLWVSLSHHYINENDEYDVALDSPHHLWRGILLFSWILRFVEKITGQADHVTSPLGVTHVGVGFLTCTRLSYSPHKVVKSKGITRPTRGCPGYPIPDLVLTYWLLDIFQYLAIGY